MAIYLTLDAAGRKKNELGPMLSLNTSILTAGNSVSHYRNIKTLNNSYMTAFNNVTTFIT
jgi:hypothetical protein